MEVIYKPIGIIHSPFNRLEEMPIQPVSDASRPGVAEIFPEFAPGLKDLAGFSHIYLIYHLHQIVITDLLVTPFLDQEPHGIFATRAPSRPNPIGLSLVEITKVEGNLIYLNRIDVLDGTPLLDIKPFIPEFEPLKEVHIGWLEQIRNQIPTRKSDSRFIR